MKTLVIVDHPQISTSIIHKRWMQELMLSPEKFEIHHLNALYPNSEIDVAFEQQLISSFDRIVFQFPFYWFNCPPLLKKWLDEVLTYGWAYGKNSGYAFHKKEVYLAISAGIDEEEYTHMGKYKYTIEELLRPFELTFEYIKTNYRGTFIYYGL